MNHRDIATRSHLGFNSDQLTQGIENFIMTKELFWSGAIVYAGHSGARGHTGSDS